MRAFALACLALASCATGGDDHYPAATASASPEAMRAVRCSPAQRFVREAPTVVRKGVAHLVTLVPLAKDKAGRLAPAVAAAFMNDRLEWETATRLQQLLSAEEIVSFAAALDSASVQAVVSASVAYEPDAALLARFVADRLALSDERSTRVQALMAASWSPSMLDRLSRAPVAAAGRVVAAALADDDSARRAELLRVAEAGRPVDAAALLVACAFLWRELDDAVLDEATAYFTSSAGQRATAAVLEAAISSLLQLALEVEGRVH